MAAPSLTAEVSGENETLKESLDSVRGFAQLLAAAETAIPLIGLLYRRKVIVYLCGRSLPNLSTAQLIQLHAFARENFDPDISIHTTVATLSALVEIEDMPAFRFDIGFARASFADEIAHVARLLDTRTGSVSSGSAEILERLVERIRGAVDAVCPAGLRAPEPSRPTDVVLYGFGRIGRIVARVLAEKTGTGERMLLRAIVVRPKLEPRLDLEKRASLFTTDSIHGRFVGVVTVDYDTQTLVINGNPVKIIYAKEPEAIDYTTYGIDNAIVVDNTGAFTNREALSRHLACNGVKRVVLTAPAKGGDVTTVVVGVNDDRIHGGETIYSAASCTTNAIVPVLRSMHDRFGIRSAHIETVHAFTNDQNLHDNLHKKERRGRSAVQNMVLTETGAAKAVALAVPELKGKLTGSAIRVPVSDVSIAVLVLDLDEESITRDEILHFLKQQAISGPFHRQIGFSSAVDAASSDFIGERRTAVIDAPATKISPDGRRVFLYLYYDNEYGYSCQVIRLLQRIAGVCFPEYPPEKPIERRGTGAGIADLGLLPADEVAGGADGDGGGAAGGGAAAGGAGTE